MHQSQGKIDERLADNDQLNIYLDFFGPPTANKLDLNQNHKSTNDKVMINKVQKYA